MTTRRKLLTPVRIVIALGVIVTVIISTAQYRTGSRFLTDEEHIRSLLHSEGITNVTVNAYAVKNRIVLLGTVTDHDQMGTIESMRARVNSPLSLHVFIESGTPGRVPGTTQN